MSQLNHIKFKTRRLYLYIGHNLRLYLYIGHNLRLIKGTSRMTSNLKNVDYIYILVTIRD
jgi:hypothetical protein